MTLRLSHEGWSSLRLEGPIRLRFDPREPVQGGELVVVTWNEAERVQGVVDALRSGLGPRVVATAPMLAWLGESGPLQGLPPPVDVDGVSIQALPYAPVPYIEMPQILYKTRSALRDPLRAVGRLRSRMGLAPAPPACWSLRAPDLHVVHLNCALHRWTPDAWLDEAKALLGGAHLLVVGVDHGMEAQVESRVGAFRARRVVLADLVGDVRRSLDLPTDPLTPLCDRLRRQGVDAHVLAPQASLRFDDLQ